MSVPLEISLKNELLFIKSLLIPAFDSDNKLDASKERKEWLKTRGVQKKWSLDILTELIEQYGTVNSLEEAKAERTKVEGLLEKAEENERKQGASTGGGLNMLESNRALFTHFRSTPPPESFGAEHCLPSGLRFLFTSAADTGGIMIVRECYSRILSIIRKQLQVYNSGGGALLFSGGQGNGKTWLSLYIVWVLVHHGRTVVYESRQLGFVYVIRADGGMYRTRCPANAAGQDGVPELDVDGTIHVFDAKASKTVAGVDPEPVESTRAFLIEISSHNVTNYEQTSRRPDFENYCVPSYTVEELLKYNDLFKISEDEVKHRCSLLGPSIRYVLVNKFDRSLEHTDKIAKAVRAKAMDQYINNTLFGDKHDISACLMLVIVHEEDFFDNPDDAYRECNVEWTLASKYLANLILDTARKDATGFVRNFIIDVNEQGLTKMKGVAGNYLEVIVDAFLRSGSFTKCRRLESSASSVAGPFQSVTLWDKALTVIDSNDDLHSALLNCTDEGVLYSYCKNFPAIDFMAKDFTVVFQSTDGAKHSIHADTMRALCNRVREKYGDEKVVQLFFVVPEEIVSKPGETGNWHTAQPFTYLAEFEEKGEHGQKRIVKRKSTVQLEKLPADMQRDLRNLEQWVICFN